MNAQVLFRSAAALVGAAGLAVSANAQVVCPWAVATDGNWNVASNWADSDIPDTITEIAHLGLTGAYTVTMNMSPSIADLTVLNPDAGLIIPASRTLTLNNIKLFNNGLIHLNPTGSGHNALISIAPADFPLSGTGEIWMRCHSDNSQITGVGSLIQEENHTIRGVGDIHIDLTNHGEIWADVAVSAGGSELSLVTNAKANDSLMGAEAGSYFDIYVEVDQAGGGIIRALDTGVVRLYAGANIIGGTLDSLGSGRILALGGISNITGVTNTGMLYIDPADTLTVSGGLVNNETVLLNAIGSNYNSYLNISDDSTISGTGEVWMQTSSDNSQINGTAGATNGSGHTIRGVGWINADLINNGQIVADAAAAVSGDSLALRSLNKVNNGLMLAADGSLLDISVTIDQTGGGTIRALDGGIVGLVHNGYIEGGTIDSVGTGYVWVHDGTASVNGVLNTGTVEINFDKTLGVYGGGLTNDGVIKLNSAASSYNARLHIFESATLDGDGEVQMRTGSDNSQINTAAGATLTHEADHLIRGAGYINAEMLNLGEVRADVSVSVSGVDLDLRSSTKVNNGLMSAAAGSWLNIYTTIDQTLPGEAGGGGVLRALDGGVVRTMGNSSVVIGGTIETEGAGFYEIAGNATFDGVTIDGHGQINPDKTLTIATALANNGVMQLNPQASSYNALLTFEPGTTLDGDGEVQMRNHSNNSQLNGGPFTHAASHLIRGVGMINAELTNYGEIRADASVSVSGAQLDLRSGAKVNHGLMAAAGAFLDLEAVSVTQSAGGVLRALDGGVVRTTGNGTVLSGGSIETVASGYYAVAGSATFDAVTLNGDGQVDANEILSITGSLTNNGLMRLNPQSSSYNAHLRFAESGTLGGTGEVNMFHHNDNSRIDGIDNTIVVTHAQDHTISGDGYIMVDLINHGTIAPSDSPADSTDTITNYNNMTFHADGLLDIQLAGPGVDQYDRIAQTSGATATLGGTVDFTFIDAYIPSFGHTWTFIDGGSVIGEFDTALIPPPPGLWEYKLIYEPGRAFLVMTCAQDLNGDTLVNLDDVLTFIDAFMANDPVADINGDGFINLADVLFLIDIFDEPCGP